MEQLFISLAVLAIIVAPMLGLAKKAYSPEAKKVRYAEAKKVREESAREWERKQEEYRRKEKARLEAEQEAREAEQEAREAEQEARAERKRRRRQARQEATLGAGDFVKGLGRWLSCTEGEKTFFNTRVNAPGAVQEAAAVIVWGLITANRKLGRERDYVTIEGLEEMLLEKADGDFEKYCTLVLQIANRDASGLAA